MPQSVRFKQNWSARARELLTEFLSIPIGEHGSITKLKDMQGRAMILLADTGVSEAKRRAGLVNSAKAREKAKAILAERTAQRDAELHKEIDRMRDVGITSYRSMCEDLTRRGIKPPRGDVWHATTLRNIDVRRHPKQST